jgi:hypothetical protein
MRGSPLLLINIGFCLVIFGYDIALARAWVPYDHPANIVPLAFLHFAIPQATVWWHRLALIDLFWWTLFIITVGAAQGIARTLGRAFFRSLLLTQVVCLALMFATPLPLDSDQFAYAYYGSLTQRGVNPYGHYSAPLQLTPLEQRLASHWGNPPYVDRYGPGWTLANAAVLLPFASTSAEAQGRILRLIACIFAIGCSWLLWVALEGLSWRPAAFTAFALNPLVLLSTGNGGHNDIYLLFFGLVAVVLARRNQFIASSVALAIATSIKFAYFPLIVPLMAFTYGRTRSLLRAIAVMLAFIALLLASAIPLTVQLSLIDVLLAFNSAHPPPLSYYFWRVFYHIPGMHWIPIHPFTLVIPAIVVGCSLVIAYHALSRRRSPVVEGLLAFAILAMPYKIESWYGIMLSPMLLIQRRWAVALYVGVTAYCQFLQVRIFYKYNTSLPYLVAIFIFIAATGLAMFVLRLNGPTENGRARDCRRPQ